jgi:trk system potassium uptake protein TrkA
MTLRWPWSADNELATSFVVIGCGRFGSAVCGELVRSSANVLAIDQSQKAIDDLQQQEPTLEARVVDGTDEEALRAAGVLDVGTVVVAIGTPIEASITATLIVKDSQGSQVRQVIARATSDLHEKMLSRVGADRVVFPSKMQGLRLGQELVRPNLLERLPIDACNSIEEIRVPEAFIGRSLGELNLRKDYNVSVLAVGPPHQLMVNPTAAHVLKANDLMVVMGPCDVLAGLSGPRRR